MPGSHLINTRSGVWMKEKQRKMQERIGRMRTETANLCAGHVVVRRSQPPCGDAPSSRLVASPNLWPRHLRLFMRCLSDSASFKSTQAGGEILQAQRGRVVLNFLLALGENYGDHPCNQVNRP